MNIKIITILIAIAPTTFLPYLTLADTAVIKNEIRAEANTGNKSSSGGVIETGEASASVKVRTEINGEVVEDIERESKGKGKVEVSVEAETNTNDAEPDLNDTGVSSSSDSLFTRIFGFFARLQSFIFKLF